MSRMLLALALGIPVGVMAAGAGTDTDAKGTSGEVQPAAATGGKVSAGPAGQGSPEVSGAGARLLGAPTAKGYRIHAVALDYGKPLLSANHLDKGFRVDVAVDGKPVCSRSVERVYLNHAPSVGSRPSTGQHLILELDPFDSCAPAHEYRAENEAPMSFRTKDAQGKGGADRAKAAHPHSDALWLAPEVHRPSGCEAEGAGWRDARCAHLQPDG